MDRYRKCVNLKILKGNCYFGKYKYRLWMWISILGKYIDVTYKVSEFAPFTPPIPRTRSVRFTRCFIFLPYFLRSFKICNRLRVICKMFLHYKAIKFWLYTISLVKFVYLFKNCFVIVNWIYFTLAMLLLIHGLEISGIIHFLMLTTRMWSACLDQCVIAKTVVFTPRKLVFTIIAIFRSPCD